MRKYLACHSLIAIIERNERTRRGRTLSRNAIDFNRARKVCSFWLDETGFPSRGGSGRENGDGGIGERKGWKGRGSPVCGTMEL